MLNYSLYEISKLNFFLEKIVGSKNRKHSRYRNTGVAKSNISSTLGCHANGLYVPTTLIFPYERVPGKYSAAATAYGFPFAGTKSGWQDSGSFLFYLKHVLSPHLNQHEIKRPVALFVDGHKSHLGLDVFKFCLREQLILTCLYPNSTHKLAPLDLKVNKHVKDELENSKADFFKTGKFLTLESFPEVYHAALERSLLPKYAQQGFFSAGLYPFNFENIDTSDLWGGSKNLSKVTFP